MRIGPALGWYQRAALHKLLLLDYRHLQRWYWEFRTPDLYRSATVTESEIAVITGILDRYGVESVLDVGCGSGRLFPAYKRAGLERILGVDIARGALSRAAAEHPDVETRHVRVEHLSASDQFDAIVTHRVLQHIDPVDLPEALDRMSIAARKIIYLNEIGDSEGADVSGSHYMFRHDYVSLMSARGWVLAERALMPGTSETYLVFRPGPAYRQETYTGTRIAAFRRSLRNFARPVNRLVAWQRRLGLRWIYLRESIEGVQNEVRRMRTGHADSLRQFGATVAEDAGVVGPLSIVNARHDFSNLSIGARTHIGSEVFLDLADRITIEDCATIAMRVVIITHLDVGRGPLILQRPRQLGPVTIGYGAFIGAGAVLLHGISVGRLAVVSAGAVVTKDIPDGVIVRRDGTVVRPRRRRTT